MNSYALSDQLLQFVLNTLIAFGLFSLLTIGCMRLFRIRSHRLRALFRLVPVARLAIEPFFWIFPSQVTLVNLSLLSCSNPLQHFLFGKLSSATQQELSLHGLKTATGSFFLMIPTPILSMGIAAVVGVALLRVGALIMHYRASIVRMNGICQRAEVARRAIESHKLLRQLEKQRTSLMVSSEIHAPFAGWGNTIVVPKELSAELSQEEFESVVAHELEHLRWRDTSVKMVYHFIAAIFWWVPMKWGLRKLEHEQELACDRAVHRYALSGLDLAFALKKTAEQKAAKRRGKGLMERIKAALAPLALLRQNKLSAAAGMIIILGLVISLGFVIC